MSTRVHRLCTWSGIAMAVLTAIGAVLIGRFIPPFMSPADTATVVAERYAEHANRVRLGAIVSALGLTLIVPFGAEIAARTRRLESSRPVLTYIQVASESTLDRRSRAGRATCRSGWPCRSPRAR
jgi:hypothetical protein